MKRLGYRKSRTGCLQCKERRVKCDEGRPCSACARHAVPCSLGGSPLDLKPPPPIAERPKRIRQSSSTRKSRASKGSPSLLSPGSDNNTPSARSSSRSSVRSDSVPSCAVPAEQETTSSQADPFIYFSKLFADIKPAAKDHCLADIELMHHYTALSYRTLTNIPTVQEALQYDIPRLALTSPFLLHQILAFSGYHLAYLQKDRRHAYLVQASQHQNLAIDGIRTTLAGPVTFGNCHSLFAASVLLTVCAFAILPSYDRYNGSFDPMDSILDIFKLVKGMSTIRDASQHNIKSGPLARLFTSIGPQEPTAQELGLQQIYLKALELEASLLGSEVNQAIRSAVTALSGCISQVSSRQPKSSALELRAAFLWPILIPADYVELIHEREPAAMVVLAYYCTILHVAEPSCWVVHGWAECLMKCISDSLRGSPWEEMIAWPLEATSTV